MEGKAASWRTAGLPARRPPPPGDGRRRGVPEADIVELLAHGGSAHLVAAGQGEEARGLASEALDRWVRSGLAYETGADGRRRFDPAEVVNGFKWAGLEGLDDFWRDRWIPTGRRLMLDLAAQDPDRRRPARVSLSRQFDLAAFADDAELLLRAPGPLEGPDHTVTAFAAEVSHADLGRMSISDARITLRLRRGRATEATLGWTASLAPAREPAGPAPLTSEEAELYLRPAEGLVQVSPRIRELAELWARKLTGWDAATAFRLRIGESSCLGVVGYEAFEPRGAMDWVLDHGWFDCLLGSALLISLCRARGMPARMVSGRYFYPLHASVHSWAEVWTQERGWTPIDLAAWDLSAGDADADWRDAFLGRVERRLVTERPPRRVMGPMSVPFPAAWRLLPRVVGGGLETRLVDARSGRASITDRVHVALEPNSPP